MRPVSSDPSNLQIGGSHAHRRVLASARPKTALEFEKLAALGSSLKKQFQRNASSAIPFSNPLGGGTRPLLTFGEKVAIVSHQQFIASARALANGLWTDSVSPHVMKTVRISHFYLFLYARRSSSRALNHAEHRVVTPIVVHAVHRTCSPARPPSTSL